MKGKNRGVINPRLKLHHASRASYEIPLSRTAKLSISNDECRFTIDELWMSLSEA